MRIPCFTSRHPYRGGRDDDIDRPIIGEQQTLSAQDILRGQPPVPEDPQRLMEEIEALGDRLASVRDRIGRVIFGQQQVIDRTLVTLLAGGLFSLGLVMRPCYSPAKM